MEQRFRLDLYADFMPQGLGMREAKNVFDFVLSNEFLGLTYLYPLQFEVLRDFFEEYCPECTSDINSLDGLVLLEYGRCPRCGKTKLDFFKEGRVRFYNEIVGVAGTKAGKTTLVGSMIAPYVLHKTLFRINNLRDYLGIIPWETLVFVFNATSREQAQLTGWDHFLSTVHNSFWFRSYTERIKEHARELELKPDDIVSESTTRLEFKFCRLLCGCFHSNAFSLAGGTFYFAMVDELSRFERTNSRRSAAEIVRVVKNNLFPVRNGFYKLLNSGSEVVNEVMDGFLAVVSAPLLEDDKTMQLLEGAKREKRRFVFYRSTFEANPGADRSLIAADEEEDPERVVRDFDALPRSAGDLFIGDSSVLVRNALGTDRLLLWNVISRPAGMVNGRLNFRLCLQLQDCVVDKTRVIFIHADTGRVKDSFGIVVASVVGDVSDYKILIHEVVDIAPREGVKGFQEVDFESVFEFMKRLSENFVIGGISYDRWNSVSYVQRLRNLGLPVEEVNLKMDDFLAFKQDLFQNKIVFPRPRYDDWFLRSAVELEPVSKMLKELYMMRNFGNRIDHPPGGSSDLAVCCVGVHRLIIRKWLGVSVKGIQVGRVKNIIAPTWPIGRIIRLSRFR
jgi:hypothetical protein